MLLIVLALSLPFLFVLARRPVLRRLAIRNAVRRPRESLLVIAGSLLGTAIMTGSFVVGDTFTASIRASAHDQLGPVDEVVSVIGLDAGTQLRERLLGLTSDDVDGVLAITSAPVAVATTGSGRRAAPKAQVLETDFEDARTFGGDAGATGISGPTPGPGQAVVIDDLAQTLRVDAGDTVEVFAYGTRTRLEIARVLPQRGVAGFWLGREATSENLFVAPGTIAALRGRGAGAGEPPVANVAVSNRGGVEQGDDARSAQVSRLLTARLHGVRANVADVKHQVLDAATRAGDRLSQLYTALGIFAVLAGILLLVNIFFMLADERKSELGMLRAIGLRRASLLGVFATEGWFYAVLSAIAGTFVGLGLGRVIMAGASRILTSGPDETRLRLRFAFTWSSVERGLAVGFVIALATVLLTSVWLSRFNIISAIRDITEQRRAPAPAPHAVRGRGARAHGVGADVSGGERQGVRALMIGPVLVLAGVGPLLARVVPRRGTTSVLAALVLVWGVVSVPIAVELDAEIGVFLFVIQGVVLVASAVVLVSQHQSAIGHALSRFASRSLRVRLGLAYPLARKFRTAMTLGMFALVVFILVFVSVVASMFQQQVDNFTNDASGGFNVVVESNPGNPVPFERIASEPGVAAIAPMTRQRSQIKLGEHVRAREGFMSAFDERFIAGGAPFLDERGTYRSDADAYRAVLASDNLVIIDDFFLSEGVGPPSRAIGIGDSFVVRDPASGRARTLTVAAIGTDDRLDNGGLIGMRTARDLYGARAVPSRAYVAVGDPVRFADTFAGKWLANGGKAETIRHRVETFLSQQQQFFLLMRGYLALGLIVGIAGIGVIMVRAVRERRHQVGVLRALGFDASAVRSAFVIESAFVAVEGVLIGVVLALLTTFSITLTDTFGRSMQFTVPLLTIVLLVAGTLVFALLATAAPARAAARIRPAVALRIAD